MIWMETSPNKLTAHLAGYMGNKEHWGKQWKVFAQHRNSDKGGLRAVVDFEK